MYPIQKNPRIYLIDVVEYNKKTKTYFINGEKIVLKDENELIQLLVSTTNFHFSSNPINWTNEYVEWAMMSANDCVKWYDFNGNISVQSRRYLFYDADGRILDIRNYWEKALAYIKDNIKKEKISHYGLMCPLVRNPLKKRCRFYRSHPKSHAGKARRYTKNMSYARTIRQNYDEVYEYNGYTYVVKAKPKNNIGIYHYDHAARHSYGWKDKKLKKQWMHNEIEREKHMKNKSKKQCS